MTTTSTKLLSSYENKHKCRYGITRIWTWAGVDPGSTTLELCVSMRDVDDTVMPRPPRDWETLRFLPEDIEPLIRMLQQAKHQIENPSKMLPPEIA